MPDNDAPKCSVKECKRQSYSRGYCRKHYEQARRGGEFDGTMFTGDYVLLEHEKVIHPLGYADRHRPDWHKKAYGGMK